jgi:hypothetical protein
MKISFWILTVWMTVVIGAADVALVTTWTPMPLPFVVLIGSLALMLNAIPFFAVFGLRKLLKGLD